MGAVRTTFAMVAAVIVRRKMLLARGLEDPYPSRSSLLSNLGSGSYNSTPGISTVSSRSFLHTNLLTHICQPTNQVWRPYVIHTRVLMNLVFLKAATDIKLAQALENASAQQDQNKSLLRLTYVLQQRTYHRGLISGKLLYFSQISIRSLWLPCSWRNPYSWRTYAKRTKATMEWYWVCLGV